MGFSFSGYSGVRRVFSVLTAYTLMLAFTLYDIRFVSTHFAERGYEGIADYHVSTWGLLIPLLILIIGAYIYLSRRFRYNLTGYHTPAFLDAVTFAVTAFTLLYLGFLDIMYFLLQGQQVPAELPWLDSTIIGILFKPQGQPHVTSMDLWLTFIISQAAIALLLVTPLWRRKR